MESCTGIKGTALELFSSYLSFSVKFGGSSSTSGPLHVESLKVLSLALLFSPYMLQLASIFRKYGILFHCYVDESQIYFPLIKDSTAYLIVLLDCLHNITSWLA